MNTKIYTPEQARLIKQKAHDEAVAANERLKARRLDAAERKEHIEQLKAMGLWEVGA